MQNMHPANDTQPLDVTNAANAPAPAAGASGQGTEQTGEVNSISPLDSAMTASGLDVVLEASLESFPASDPPAWT